LSCFAFQLNEPFGGGVRFGVLEPAQVLGITRVLTAGPAQLDSSAGVDLLVHRVVWLALDNLARGEAKGLGSGSPPAAGCFAGLGSVDVVPAGRPPGVAVLSLPDVAEVVALGDGNDHS
jgi:hypothetical protein